MQKVLEECFSNREIEENRRKEERIEFGNLFEGKNRVIFIIFILAVLQTILRRG